MFSIIPDLRNPDMEHCADVTHIRKSYLGFLTLALNHLAHIYCFLLYLHSGVYAVADGMDRLCNGQQWRPLEILFGIRSLVRGHIFAAFILIPLGVLTIDFFVGRDGNKEKRWMQAWFWIVPALAWILAIAITIVIFSAPCMTVTV